MCCQTPGAGTRVFCRWAPSIFLSCQKQQPQRNAERNHCNVWNVKAGEKNSVKTVECVVTQCFTTVQVSSPEWTSAVIPCFFLPVKSKLVVHCRALIYEIPVSACHPPTSRRMNISEQLWWCHQTYYIYNTVQWGIPHNNIDTVWGKEHFSLFSFCCIVYWDIVYMMEEWLGIPPYSKDIAGSIPCGSGLSVCVVSSRFSNLLISWTSILYV